MLANGVQRCSTRFGTFLLALDHHIIAALLLGDFVHEKTLLHLY